MMIISPFFQTGTMGAPIKGTIDQFEKDQGSLYMLKNGCVVKQISKIGLSNGLAWSLDKKLFYYIDSLKYRVDSYDYDDLSGSICKYIVTYFTFQNQLNLMAYLIRYKPNKIIIFSITGNTKFNV